MAREAPMLLAVPNVSEGHDVDVLEKLAGRCGPACVLDIHADRDHNRAVFTLAGPQGAISEALVEAARAATELIDLRRQRGLHPRVGAIDVAPVVYLDDALRGAACAEALTAAGLIGHELGIPVFLYGELATSESRRERADIRRGGTEQLAKRMARRELRPDFGPARIERSKGALLVTARPPLIAFNLDLAEGDEALARQIAAELREGDGGLPGVRALGLYLAGRQRAQVSFNVHDHTAVPLAVIAERVRARAEIAEGEIVGLAPAAALMGFPDDIPLRGFDPEIHLIENALRSLA